MPIEEIEKDVLKKTNKYVYLSNGTHMSHSDFHKYKQNIRNEFAIIHAKEYEDSVEVLVQSIKERDLLQDAVNKVKEQCEYLEYQLQSVRDCETPDWEKMYKSLYISRDESIDKLTKKAQQVYKDLKGLPILKDYQNDKGIKFIIQQNCNTDEHRFCFDPYEFGNNFHSTLSEYFREDGFGTINGGWLKVIDDVITLYAQSGDYGTYDNAIAIECAKLIFPNKTIKSFAGISWNEINN